MEFLNQLGAIILQHKREIFLLARSLSVIAIVASCLGGAVLIAMLPFRIRFGIIKLENLVKLAAILILFAWGAAATWAVIWLEFIVIAKLLLVHVFIIGSLAAWVLILCGPELNRMLIITQAQCELASNLTFLQADIVRAQLAEVNERIRRAVEPEEQEFTDTMLRTMSPLVSLFIKRERSVIKWSIAAVDVGKTMMRYFFSDKK